MLNYPYFTIPLALVPNIMLALPVYRTCKKRGVSPLRWVLTVCAFPPIGLPLMIATYSHPDKRAKAVRTAAIAAALICGAFWISAWVFETV